METINDVELRDESVYPDDAVLKKVLGDSFAAYQALLELFKKHGLVYEWRYYKDGKAWLCKVQKKTRTIVWMSAWKGFMQATVYIPGKHLDALYALDMADSVKARIEATKNVGKSKPCIFEVRSTAPFADLEKLIIFKLAS